MKREAAIEDLLREAMETYREVDIYNSEIPERIRAFMRGKMTFQEWLMTMLEAEGAR